jgi:quaternary ammonium compound-resistance protein SugE
MDWFYLCGAGVLEVVASILLKKLTVQAGRSRQDEARRRRNLTAALLALAGSIGSSLYLLALATRSIPIGTAYAVWTGIGSVGSVAAGIFLFKETCGLRKLVCLAMIVAGVIGLRVTS